MSRVPRSLAILTIAFSSIVVSAAHAQLTLYIVRHGQTDWNREGKIQGAADNSLLVSHLIGVPPQEGASAICQSNDEVYSVELPRSGAASIWKLVPRNKLGEL